MEVNRTTRSDPVIRNDPATAADLRGEPPLRPEPRDVPTVRHTGIAKWTAGLLGVIFLIVGVLGFFQTDDMLFELFMVNTFHNLVHIVSGSILLLVAFLHERVARATLWTFAIVYGLVTILGFAGVDPMIELMHLNNADNWLHLLLTAMFVGGALASHAATRTAAHQPRTIDPVHVHNTPPPRL